MGKVGEILRQRRESQSQSLEEVRGALGIPMHYLQAMESGKTSLVADEFYLIPFLRRYAEYLELDPASTVAQFLSEAAREEARGGGGPRGGEVAGGSRWIVFAVGGAIAVAVAVWLLWPTS